MIQAVLNPHRAVLSISGAEAADFLQGLITNDIKLLEEQPCIYACFLTAQGKFLHDFHIFRQDKTYFLTPEKERIDDLVKRLKMYRLRAKVDIQIIDYLNVFQFFGETDTIETLFPADSLLAADPRNQGLGYVGIFSDTSVDDLKKRSDGMGAAAQEHEKTQLQDAGFNDYDTMRINHKIPDGSRDMLPEKAIILEYGLDNLNAISYDKGCYLGQELTARTHYRGLIRKKLHVVSGDLPAAGTALYSKGSEKSTAVMGSSTDTIGLALVRDGTEFPLHTESDQIINAV